ncbi:hypothetical protein B0H13DRAFT_1593279, partial [Mycena leptocephala]
ITTLQPKTRPKHSHRAATTPLPLKSALKKTGAAGNVPSVAPEPHAESSQLRRRTNSKVKPDQYAAGVPPNQALNPPRRESLVRLSLPSGQLYETLNTRSDHMFVTFKGDSELLLENTLEHARQEIEKKIFPLWPHGAETQFRGSDWIVRFRNAPWNMSGPDVALAWRLITALFTLFAERGFMFMTSTKCTTTQPRLIFQATPGDKRSVFFLAYFSRRGRRVSLINPPRHIAVAFGPKLRAFLPNQIEVSEDKDMLIVETKREIGGPGGTSVIELVSANMMLNKCTVKPSHFLMQILKALMDMQFDLNATVPMARGGPLGMGSRRELLVFKGFVSQ